MLWWWYSNKVSYGKGGEDLRKGKAKKTIPDDLLIISNSNASGDLVEMHRTGARYYLTVTDGASGRFIVSNGYASLRLATKDYIKVSYLIENNIYDFDFWASIVH